MKFNRWGLLVLITGLATSAYATEEGFYLGAQAGVSATNNKAQDVQTDGTPPVMTISPSNNGFGGRLFFGYSANPYVAMEGGWTYLAPSTYSIPSSVAPSVCGNPTIQESAFDVVGKGTLQVQDFGAFFKAGAAFTFQKLSGRLVDQTAACVANQTNKSIRPVAAIGVSYDLTQNWVTDLTWMRIFGNGTFQSADLVALGITYHFVDKRCGQFLC